LPLLISPLSNFVTFVALPPSSECELRLLIIPFGFLSSFALKFLHFLYIFVSQTSISLEELNLLHFSLRLKKAMEHSSFDQKRALISFQPNFLPLEASDEKRTYKVAQKIWRMRHQREKVEFDTVS